ncbi:hypothetical protein N6B72_04870 [Chryseobacterium soli]|uniref:hypothetical protein n=1 Tax=Chryseobacterium soli TaxID=445961 RepID=UPI0029541359|nr:hypothetical protein [Chryseobacterium soli]MDV7696250.1 hypothetical protein [Chryseobacterium soli]
METEYRQTQLSTPPSRTNRGKILLQRTATILVLLSSLVPFFNNFIRHFFDTEAIVFANVSGVRKLDLDSCIFFLSMPVAFFCVAFGAYFKAHKYSFIAVFISCYFQFAFLIRFIFLDKNDIFIISEIAIFVLFAVIGFLMFKAEKHFSNIIAVDSFKEKTLDRYSSILLKKK